MAKRGFYVLLRYIFRSVEMCDEKCSAASNLITSIERRSDKNTMQWNRNDPL